MTSQEAALSGTELPVLRRSLIVRRLAEAGVIRTQDLSDELRVSVETVRRDLAVLESEGILERVHGGAASVDQRLSEEPSFLDRSAIGESAKSRIGAAAASLVRDGSTVFLDVGTTALNLALALPMTFRGVVVTNSLPAAAELAKRPHADVLVTGGRVRGGDLAMAGQHALDLLESIRADVAFLGSGGVHAASGLTDFHLEEVAGRHVMMRNSAKSYVLADSSKFNRIAPFHVGDWDAFSGLITDEEPPTGLHAAVTLAGAEVIVGS
jgi:DeoR/GlpR family transcriptional regulator of sugar metabolism